MGSIFASEVCLILVKSLKFKLFVDRVPEPDLEAKSLQKFERILLNSKRRTPFCHLGVS
jgi:hypothetical protein